MNDLFVRSDFRKKGVGEKLLDKCVEFALDTKSKGLVLETAITNLVAQKLYEKKGWTRDADFYRYNYITRPVILSAFDID